MMRYLASVQMAVNAVCGRVSMNIDDSWVTIVVGNTYAIYIADIHNPGQHSMVIRVHKLGDANFPTEEFPCNLNDLREQLTTAYHGCLLEAI